MDGDKAAKDGAIDRFLARGKDSVALLRDAALLMLAVLLLVFPKTLNNVLTSAGFEEGSIVGFKWKAKLVESDEALNSAKATIASLQTQLDKTTFLLKKAQTRVDDQTLSQNITRLQQENIQVGNATEKVQANIASTLQTNIPFIEKARKSVNLDAIRRIPPPDNSQK